MALCTELLLQLLLLGMATSKRWQQPTISAKTQGYGHSEVDSGRNSVIINFNYYLLCLFRSLLTAL